MPRLQYEHGTIRPVINGDGTFELACASPSCNRPVQPWGPRGNWMVWRHTAPERPKYDATRSKWIVPFGDGFILQDPSVLFWKPLKTDSTTREKARKFLGVIEIDSGTLVVGDPAYLLPRAEDGKPGVDYQVVIDSGLSAFQPFDKVSMLFTTPDGDGPLAVYGEFEDGELWKVSIILDAIEFGEDE
jgi:hypothetical protein